MKKPTGKGSSLKGGGGSSSATPVTDRKSRWESADNPASGHPTTAGDLRPSSKPPNPKDISAGPSAAGPPTLSPHDRSIHPSSVPPPLHPLHPLANSPFPQPDPAAGPPAPPSYGFHNLDRRTIVLADGSVRSYFALPPDYPMDPPAPERFFPYGPSGRPGLGPGPELGLDRHFPPPGPRFSPESFRDREREPPPFGRGPGAPQHDYWSSLGLDGPRGPPEGGQSSLKRKYGEDDEFAWHRQHVLQYGNPNGIPSGSGGDRSDYLGRAGSPLRREHPDDLRLSKQAKFGGEGPDVLPPRRGQPDNDVPPVAVDVDQQALKRAFLKFAKVINENLSQRKNYLEDGKNGPLKCIVCDRASKEFADVHGLIMHAYNSQNADLHVDHLGLHKALCVLLGWSFAKAPENSKAYQSLSDDVVTANREDLIIWPPTVIIHNTNSGRRKDGRMEGLGNKDMDTKLKELGFGGGKSKSMYGKEGHTGITLVKFANTHAGLKEAERLADFFVKDHHGRKGWARAQASQSGDDDEKNPALVKADEKTGEKKRIFYGYLATVSDLEKVDHEMRKKAVIKSRKEFDLSD